jgi:hypothetical protein
VENPPQKTKLGHRQPLTNLPSLFQGPFQWLPSAIVKDRSVTNANTVHVHAGNASWGLSIGIEPLGFVIIGGIIVAGDVCCMDSLEGRKSKGQ